MLGLPGWRHDAFRGRGATYSLPTDTCVPECQRKITSRRGTAPIGSAPSTSGLASATGHAGTGGKGESRPRTTTRAPGDRSEGACVPPDEKVDSIRVEELLHHHGLRGARAAGGGSVTAVSWRGSRLMGGVWRGAGVEGGDRRTRASTTASLAAEGGSQGATMSTATAATTRCVELRQR